MSTKRIERQSAELSDAQNRVSSHRCDRQAGRNVREARKQVHGVTSGVCRSLEDVQTLYCS